MTDITHMTLRQMKDSLRNASPRSKHEFNLLALKHGQRNVLLGEVPLKAAQMSSGTKTCDQSFSRK